MMKIRFFCLLLILIAISIVTQANEVYRLRELSPSDYVALSQETFGLTGYEAKGDVLYALEDDFLRRYGNSATIPELKTFFEAYNYVDSPPAYYHPLDILGWQGRAINQWFEKNLTDLSVTQTIKTDDFSYTVVNIQDANGDGEADWLLNVEVFDSGYYWLAIPDSQTTSGYQFYPIPVPYSGTVLVPLDNADINADGKDEFWFMTRTSDQFSPVPDFLFVVGWRNGKPESILSTDVIDDDSDFWHTANLDDDKALEIVQDVVYEDNWHCTRESRIVFDWNGTSYEAGKEENSFADTINCDVRQAEEAMFAKDYEAAIPYYQDALARYDSISNAMTQSPYAAYAAERLVIAYLYLSRNDDAKALIDEINLTPQTPDTIAAAYQALPSNLVSPIAICKAASDAVNNLYWRAPYRGELYIGYINEAFYGEPYHSSHLTEKSSCDLYELASVFAFSHQFPTDKSPLDSFEVQGYELTTLANDLNNDGIEDWVVWVDDSNNAIFFLSDGDYYQVSNTNLPRPDEHYITELIELPQNSGLGYLNYAPYEYNEFDCVEGNPVNNDATVTNSISIYALKNNQLVRTFTDSICFNLADDEPISLGDELVVWNFQSIRKAAEVTVSETLLWDAEEKTYVRPSATAEAQQRDREYWHVRTALDNGEYAKVLENANVIIPKFDDGRVYELRYYRALAYQLQGNNEQALDEYVALYQDAPDSIWGKLAGMQIEIK